MSALPREPSEEGAAAGGPLEEKALAELEAAGRRDTLVGEALLYVAKQLDSGGHSGSQSAALLQRLLETRTAALAGAKPVADPVDELLRRRQARAVGA